MQIPDVVGFPLGEARALLEKSGWSIGKIVLLLPPRDKNIEYNDHYRVIRILEDDVAKLELQICKPL